MSGGTLTGGRLLSSEGHAQALDVTATSADVPGGLVFATPSARGLREYGTLAMTWLNVKSLQRFLSRSAAAVA